MKKQEKTKEQDSAQKPATKTVVANSGHTIVVDISDETMAPFGFKSGDKIISPNKKGRNIVVEGVAPCEIGDPDSEKVLWITTPENFGKASFTRNWKAYVLQSTYDAQAKEIAEIQEKLKTNGGLKVISRSGDIFYVDSNDAVCKSFGFKSEEIGFDPIGNKVIFKGVAPSEISFGVDRLWYVQVGDFGKVSGWSSEPHQQKLKEQGFISEKELKTREKLQEILVKNNGLKVISCSGNIFYVDPSDESCMRFGFKSQETIFGPKGEKFIVKGVAPSNYPYGPYVLWVLKEGEEEVGYYDPEPSKANLREQGFITEAEAIQKQKDLEAKGVKVTDSRGNTFFVDSSDSACEPFGHKAGDEFPHPICPTKIKAVGVAPINKGVSGELALWCDCEKDGCACPFSPNLEKEIREGVSANPLFSLLSLFGEL